MYCSIVYYYNGAQRYEQFLQVGRLCRALILLGLALGLPSVFVSSVFIVLYMHILNKILLTSLTNHHPSVLWHCWLGHLTRKIVSKMTYNVLNGTLNPTILLGLFVGSVILCDGIREWWRSHVSNPTNAQVWRAADTFLCRGGYAGINVSPSAWHHLQVL